MYYYDRSDGTVRHTLRAASVGGVGPEQDGVLVSDKVFKKGDEVWIFDRHRPDSPVKTRVTAESRTIHSPLLRVEGDTKYEWRQDGQRAGYGHSDSRRLVTEAELPALQAEARARLARKERCQAVRDAVELAHREISPLMGWNRDPDHDAVMRVAAKLWDELGQLLLSTGAAPTEGAS